MVCVPLLKILDLPVTLFLHSTFPALSDRKFTTHAKLCLKSFNIIHNILHWGNNTSGLSNAKEEIKGNCMRLSSLCFFDMFF